MPPVCLGWHADRREATAVRTAGRIIGMIGGCSDVGFRPRGGVLLPRHSLQQFRQFVRWLSADGSRRRWMADVRLAVGSYLDATQLTDWSHEVDSVVAGA